MSDRITNSRQSGSSGAAGGMARSAVLLFPLCDWRGRVFDALREPAGSFDYLDADSIFFAWLLDLPVAMDARLAAFTLLVCSGHRDPEITRDLSSQPFCAAVKPVRAAADFRARLVYLLNTVIADNSLYEAVVSDDPTTAFAAAVQPGNNQDS